MEKLSFYFFVDFIGFYNLIFLFFVGNPVLNFFLSMQPLWNRSFKHSLLWALLSNSDELIIFLNSAPGQILMSISCDAYFSTYSSSDKFLLSSSFTQRGGPLVSRFYWMYRGSLKKKKNSGPGEKVDKSSKHQLGLQARASNTLPRKLSTNGPRPAKDPPIFLPQLPCHRPWPWTPSPQ
jgi:hypothetical protein